MSAQSNRIVAALESVAAKLSAVAALSVPTVLAYLGFRSDVVRANVVDVIAATSGTLSIPGPAAGFLRIFFEVQFTSKGSTPAITATLNPSGLLLARAVSMGAVTNGSQPLILSAAPLVLGEGETLDLENTGGADCNIFYSYHDVPKGNVTLVRVQFDDTPVEIIPASPAGFFRRWLVGTTQSGSSISARTAAIAFNDDSATAIVEYFIGGDIVSRVNSASAGAANALNLTGADWAIRSDAVTVGAHAAITTRKLNFIGAYETVAD